MIGLNIYLLLKNLKFQMKIILSHAVVEASLKDLR